MERLLDEISFDAPDMKKKTVKIGRLDDSDKNLSWSGWVSLENQSGTSYPNARLKVVAGDVNLIQNAPARMAAVQWMKAGRFSGSSVSFRNSSTCASYSLSTFDWKSRKLSTGLVLHPMSMPASWNFNSGRPSRMRPSEIGRAHV